MNYGTIKLADIANGPGCRTSLFVSGCDRHCPGCFNEQTWDFGYGEPFTEETVSYILDSLGKEGCSGLSILGGEPLHPDNTTEVMVLCAYAALLGYNIWIYTGYTWEELLDRKCGIYGKTDAFSVANILYTIDVLVDGPFIEKEKDISLRFRGSRNQRIIDVQESLKQNQVILMEDWM